MSKMVTKERFGELDNPQTEIMREKKFNVEHSGSVDTIITYRLSQNLEDRNRNRRHSDRTFQSQHQTTNPKPGALKTPIRINTHSKAQAIGVEFLNTDRKKKIPLRILHTAKLSLKNGENKNIFK